MSLISDIRPEGVRGQARSLEFARWSAILGGGAMALLGLSRRSKTGLAVAAAGGIIAYGGVALDWNAKVFSSRAVSPLIARQKRHISSGATSKTCRVSCAI